MMGPSYTHLSAAAIEAADSDEPSSQAAEAAARGVSTALHLQSRSYTYHTHEDALGDECGHDR